MASARGRRANAVTNRDSASMEGPGTPQTQALPSRIPAPTWRTTAKVSGTDATAAKVTVGTPRSGIRAPQVRTNPRVMRQGVHSKADSKSSNDSHSATSPKVSRSELEFEGVGAVSRENLSPLSPSTTLTRQGAFRYGRGVKPLEVLNFGSGASTVPRMRPKKVRDPRNLGEVFETPSKEDVGKSQASKKDERPKHDQSTTSTRKISQRPQSLGRVTGIRQISQESVDSKKSQQIDPKPAGPRISKGIKGGTGRSRGTDVKSEIKSPELLVKRQPQNTATLEDSGCQKQINRTVKQSQPSTSRAAADTKAIPIPTRSVKTEQKTTEISPKAPPRRQRTLPSATNGLSASRTPISKTSKSFQETGSTGSSSGTPTPPPRHAKPAGTNSASPRPIPTNIPRPQSLRRRASQQPGPTLSMLSPRNSLPAPTSARLSDKPSLSFPQGGGCRDPVAATKSSDERQRSHSASQIPVHVLRRSSLPPNRPVKLRPRAPQSDRPSLMFRLSLDGADSGTENSSSLTTTPSECSVDVDQSYEEGSPVSQTAPSKFYSISGLGLKPKDTSTSGDKENMELEDSAKTATDNSPVEVMEISQLTTGTDECLEEETVTHSPSSLTVLVCQGQEKTMEEFHFDNDESTTPKNENSDFATSEIKLPENETVLSGISPPNLFNSTEKVSRQKLICPVEVVDPVESLHSSNSVDRDKSVDHSCLSISDAERTFETSSRFVLSQQSKVSSSDRISVFLRGEPGAEPSKASTFTQSRRGREIALKVARGDLKASSVDGDGETLFEAVTGKHQSGKNVTGSRQVSAEKATKEDLKANSVDGDGEISHAVATAIRRTGEDLREPHENLPVPSMVAADKEMPESEGTARSSGKQVSTVARRNSRRRRKISSVESPYKALTSTETVSKDDLPSEGASCISGSTVLEKMMDTEEAIPRPNHRKDSFHLHKENSEVEQRYLQSCSDPLKLLEFLMNVEDPPKGEACKAAREEAVVVKRRAKSDVQSPGQLAQSSMVANRWSMPSTLEQWSHSFWAQLTGNGRSGQDSRASNLEVTSVSDGGVPATPVMPGLNSKTNRTPGELDRINEAGSSSKLSSSGGARDSFQNRTLRPDTNEPLRNHRWSTPLGIGSMLPSIDRTEPAKTAEKLAGPSASLKENAEPALKRKNWWRWSLPVPLRKSPRSSLHAKEPNSEHRPRQAQLCPSSQEDKEHTKEAAAVNSCKTEKRAPSFSDITDAAAPSSSVIKVFVDSTYVEQNSSLCHFQPTGSPPAGALTSDQEHLLSAPAMTRVSVSSETQDEAAASLVVRRDGSTASSELNLKKRLSWKREKSLETVCYLERVDSSELTGSEEEGISEEEECNENESASPLSLLEFITNHQSNLDDEDKEKDESEAVDCILTDNGKESSRATKTAPVPIFSPWVLPSDELKSKLESVYAERQKAESTDDDAGDIWKLDPNARSSFQFGSAGQETDPPGTSPSEPTVYHRETNMRDAVAMSTGIGKRLSLKQQLSVDPDLDQNRANLETTGLQSRSSIKDTHSGSRSPIPPSPTNNNWPKLNRTRSGSGSESVKDNRRKLDDVGHKTRLRIERDRETKSSVSPSSPGISEVPPATPPKSRTTGQTLTVPVKTETNGEPAGQKGADASLGDSLQAFHRRKKSMAIALSEGLLDLQAEHAASAEKTSELQMVSQISQLNQELMQLTQPSPPGTPPTPSHLSKGLRRSSSRGSLASLPGSSTSPRTSFPGMRLWKSVAQFQTNVDESSASPPNNLPNNMPMSDKEKSSTLPAMKRTSLKDDEDIKEKMVSPKVILSRIKQWSRKKGQSKTKARPEIVKLDPELPLQGLKKKDGEEEKEENDSSSTPRKASPLHLTDDAYIHKDTPEPPQDPLVALWPVPMSKDTALRKTWHGTPSRKARDAEDEAGDDRRPGRSSFQRCSSLRAPIRQRKRGLSPMENAHLVALQLSSETIPGSSVDSGIVKDRGTEETFLAGDSDTSSSNFCSPCSSLGSSNPPSRPLSSDLLDLQWEKGSVDSQAVANGGLLEERKLSAVTIGRRESGTGRPRRSMVSQLSLPVGFQCAGPETPDSVTSPKKVTFSLDEDLTKKAMEEDLRRLPKPLHLPRRVKTDPVDTKTIAGVVKEIEEENADTPGPARKQLRRRAQSDLSSANKRSREEVVSPVPPAITEERDTEKNGTLARPKSIPDHLSLLDREGSKAPPRKNSLADLIGTEVGEVLSTFGDQYNFEGLQEYDQVFVQYKKPPGTSQAYSPDTMPTFAEALWDHVTMDESELAFKAGDVIEVTDMRDKNWWWGCREEVEGWVPAQFLRLRVSQGETVEECMERLKEEREQIKRAPAAAASAAAAKKARKVSLNFLSNEQVRAKVVEEIITTERDYVHNLRDVCEGYIRQAADRPEMFSVEIMNNLFGNIEEIYSFQKGFLLQLEASIIQDQPQLSRIGGCFLEHRSGFETYSEYCNNYPTALRELKQLREKQKYDQFFEACRLLQNMIEINLEGFLLTPVQKICKYPLQLRELLKYTRPHHADYQELREALEVMKEVAVSINDRKRRVENIEKIAAWQKSIGDWEDEDLLEKSTQLIHSGEITMLVGKRWTSGRRAFLFDHQLVVCKKDWKGTLQYKKRIDLDVSEVSDMRDGKDLQWNITVKNAFKIHNTSLNKLHILCCKGEVEKQEWLKMFAKERESVMKDQEKGFCIPAASREAAMKNVMAGDQPSKPQDMSVVTRKVSTMPYAYQHKILETSSKKVPLPKAISSTDVFKKKGKGLFGIGKK